MKLLSISIRNFRLHAETDITFPEEGVIGIIGTNEAGKSTVLEAVTWALFGGDATRGTKAGIRWHDAPPRHTASVTLQFEVGGKVYRVERGENGAKLFEDGVTDPIADGTSAVNDHVPTILGMTHGEFSASFMVRQKDVDRLAGMDPTPRVTFVRSMMGMGTIDRGLKLCRSKKSELSQEREGLVRGLGERGPLEEAVEEAAAQALAAQSTREQAWQDALDAQQVNATAAEAFADSNLRKKTYDARTTAVHEAKAIIQSANAEVGRLTHKLTQIEKAREKVAEAEPALEKRPALQEERDQLVAVRGTVGERETLEKRCKELDEEIGGLRKTIADAQVQVDAFDPEGLAAASSLLEGAESRVADLRRIREEARNILYSEAHVLEAEAERHEKRIKALQGAGAAGGCPTCLRALGDAFDTVVGGLEEQRTNALAECAKKRAEADELLKPSDDEAESDAEREELSGKVEALKLAKTDAESATRTIKRETAALAASEKALREAVDRLERLPSLTFDQDRLTEVEAELERLGKLDKGLADDRALVSQEAETKELLADWEGKVTAAKEKVETATQALDELDFDAAVHATIEKDADEARQKVQDARVALATAQEAEKGAASQLDAAKRALSDYDSRAGRLDEVSAELLAHETTAARLDEFRAAMAATIRPEMEELMSGFVQLLTDGRHEAVTLSEDFDAVLHESGTPVEVVSGGTEDIAALAMRLALSQMIAERAGHPLSLLILDEPFGSLDETRRGNVLSLIRRLSGVFQQVVVISHVAETRDAVDHVVELEFDEQAACARVVGASPQEVAA